MTRRRIMIVDDDDSVRSLLRMTLPEDEYEIDEATDGEQALARLDERVPELVLLDWQMPGRHGSLVLDELKSRHPKLPVIVLTAEIAEHHRSLAEALKVDVFLTKPFSPLELLETIERLLAEHPLDEAS
ncbi:MAG TPA: response regulator [Gaiellaceae bacterium]|jgi:DNA-binding response OmpR family regulator